MPVLPLSPLDTEARCDQVQRGSLARPFVADLPVANLVTGLRVVLAGVVALLALLDAPPAALSLVLAAALLSDFVDGRVARATGTATALGARLDMEADAFLILVLSAVVAVDHGAWVLGLGLVRYVFAVAVRLVPGLQHQPPPRPWCKVVAALVATVLAVTALGLVPHGMADGRAGGPGRLLLAESFAHEAVDRWRAGNPVPVRRTGAERQQWLTGPGCAGSGSAALTVAVVRAGLARSGRTRSTWTS